VLALERAHADAWSNLGQVRLARGALAEAVAAFEQVVALAPDDPLAHYNLGVAHRRRGAMEAARPAFQRALALDPDLELARAALRALDGGG
jgi:tetratricopeptide (TPR) repeat protein